MQKYNFYDLKGKTVPEDLNFPVKKMILNELDCPEALDEFEDLEKHKDCGSVGIYYKDSPKHIEIKTNYGMTEGWDLVKTLTTEKFIIVTKKHIKNHNLNMKKKEGRNGPNN
jgi:hypothetical protein